MISRIGRLTTLSMVGLFTGLLSCGPVGQEGRGAGAFASSPHLSTLDSVRLGESAEVDSIVAGSVGAALSIGGRAGADPYLFQEIAAIRLDGVREELYVADRGRREVLVYGARNGRFRRSIGKRGAGPGEFQNISSMFLMGDSTLAVWDPGLSRLSQFTHAGKLLTSVQLPTAGGAPTPSSLTGRLSELAWAQDGLVGEIHSNPLEVKPSDQVGALVLLNARLEATDTVLTFHVPSVRASQNRSGGGVVTHYEAPLLFSPRAVWAAGPDGTIAFTEGGTYHLAIVGSSTRPRMLLWRTLPPQPVTQEDRLRLLAYEAQKPGSGFPPGYSIVGFEPSVRDRFSTTRPFITGLIWDGTDRVWLRRFDTTFDPAGPGGVWDVVDVNRQRLEAVVEFGAGVVPMEIGNGYLYCVHSDSLGVERVVVLHHPLRRAQG